MGHTLTWAEVTRMHGPNSHEPSISSQQQGRSSQQQSGTGGQKAARPVDSSDEEEPPPPPPPPDTTEAALSDPTELPPPGDCPPRCQWCLLRHLPGSDAEGMATKCEKCKRPRVADFDAQDRPMRRALTLLGQETPGRRRARYQTWYKKEAARLAAAAAWRLEQFKSKLSAPLESSDPDDPTLFSDWAQLRTEFATLLPSKLKAAGKDSRWAAYQTDMDLWSSVNASALQLFTAEIRASISKNVADTRMPGEPSKADFAMLRACFEENPGSFLHKINFWKVQARRRHKKNEQVRKLGEEATLMEILSATVRPKQGRPLLTAGVCTAPPPVGLYNRKKVTYAGGRFISLQSLIDLDSMTVARNTNTAKSRTLENADQLFEGIQHESELKGRKQKGKAFHVPATSTRRDLGRDVAAWRIHCAARALGPHRQVFFDGGTREDGEYAILMGSNGMLPDGRINRRMCGLEAGLPNKMGATTGKAVIAMCARNNIGRSYFPLADSAPDVVGYKSGAIAFMRTAWGTPLIISNKCAAHKVVRGLQHALFVCGGGSASRNPVKRTATETKLNRVSLQLECSLHLIKSCPQLRKRIDEEQPEWSHLIIGHVDARWTYTVYALREFIGTTVVFERLEMIYCEAAPLDKDDELLEPTLCELKDALEANAWQKMEWWTALLYEPKKGRAKKNTQPKERDMSQTVSLEAFLAAYGGPRIQPQLDVIAAALNPEGLSKEQVEEKQQGVVAASKRSAKQPASTTAASSKTSKKSAIGMEPPPLLGSCKKLTADKVPGLLLDNLDYDLRMRSAFFEVLGYHHFLPFLTLLEVRRAGVFFEAYEWHSLHARVNATFIVATDGDEVMAWSVEALEPMAAESKAVERLALHLSFALGYALWLEEAKGIDGAAQQGLKLLVDIGASYAKYLAPQFEEWESNPMYRLGFVGSTKDGPEHARWLVDQPKDKLFNSLGKVLHMLTSEVARAIDDAVHIDPITGGPLRVFSSATDECRELYAQLQEFSQQGRPLFQLAKDAKRPRCVELAALIDFHYRPVLLANPVGEELVKAYKNGTPQLAKYPESFEVHLQNYFSRIWEPKEWDEPESSWLQVTRRERKELRTRKNESQQQVKAEPPEAPVSVPWLHDGSPETDAEELESEDPLWDCEADGEADGEFCKGSLPEGHTRIPRTHCLET